MMLKHLLLPTSGNVIIFFWLCFTRHAQFRHMHATCFNKKHTNYTELSTGRNSLPTPSKCVHKQVHYVDSTLLFLRPCRLAQPTAIRWSRGCCLRVSLFSLSVWACSVCLMARIRRTIFPPLLDATVVDARPTMKHKVSNPEPTKPNDDEERRSMKADHFPALGSQKTTIDASSTRRRIL